MMSAVIKSLYTLNLDHCFCVSFSYPADVGGFTPEWAIIRVFPVRQWLAMAPAWLMVVTGSNRMQ